MWALYVHLYSLSVDPVLFDAAAQHLRTRAARRAARGEDHAAYIHWLNAIMYVIAYFIVYTFVDWLVVHVLHCYVLLCYTFIDWLGKTPPPILKQWSVTALASAEGSGIILHVHNR